MLAKFTFLCRTRMVQVGANFKGGIISQCAFSVKTIMMFKIICKKLTEENETCKKVLKYEDLATM